MKYEVNGYSFVGQHAFEKSAGIFLLDIANAIRDIAKSCTGIDALEHVGHALAPFMTYSDAIAKCIRETSPEDPKHAEDYFWGDPDNVADAMAKLSKAADYAADYAHVVESRAIELERHRQQEEKKPSVG